MNQQYCPLCAGEWPQKLFYISNVKDVKCPVCKEEKMRLRKIDIEINDKAAQEAAERRSKMSPEQIKEAGRKACEDLGW